MKSLKRFTALCSSLFLVPLAGMAEVGNGREALESFTEVQSIDLGATARSALSTALADVESITLLQGDERVGGATSVVRLERRAVDGSISTTFASSNVLTVKLSPEVAEDPATVTDIGAQLGGTLEPLGFGLFALSVPENGLENVTGTLARAATVQGVIYTEFDPIVFSQSGPSDPEFGVMWHLSNTGQTGGTPGADVSAIGAWDITTGADDIVVGVIDSGIDYTHKDLAENIWINPLESGLDANGNDRSSNKIDDDGNGFVDDWHGWNFVDNGRPENDPFDDNGHGTHVAGTIGAVSNNTLGVTGMAWKARMIPIKFLDENGRGTTQNAIRAVAYASQTSAFATNNSWGGGGNSQALQDAIDAAGTLFLAAAGNLGEDTDSIPHYPSSYDSPLILSVAATDHNDALAWFSNHGATSVDVAAPGDEILSTVPNDGYGIESGTSMATPVVAGIAVLVKAQNPGFSSVEIKERILARADVLPGLNNVVLTGARVNAETALRQVTSNDAPVGAILPYFGSVADIPVNWVPADGRRVLDPSSPLNGQDLPDLRGSFVMGSNASHVVGAKGGAHTAPNHSHQVGLTTNTVWFGRNSGNGYANAYHPATRADGFDRRYRNLTAPDGASNPYDTHGHLNGQASVRGNTAAGGAHDNRPAFVALNFIVRIK